MVLQKYIVLALFLFNCLDSKFLNKSKYLNIIPLSTCKAQLNDGRIIDLTSLDDPQHPRVAVDGDYNYKFNPCSPIPCEGGGKPASAAVCQESSDGIFKYNCGDQSSVSFSEDSGTLTMNFAASERHSTIKCICSKTESFSGGENSLLSNYEFVFNSPCCCPDGCSGNKPGKSGGLSFGSILLIIFFSLLFVYFVGGIIFFKFYKKNSGIEIVPNHQFWTSVPRDIKAGVSFTISKAKGTPYQQF